MKHTPAPWKAYQTNNGFDVTAHHDCFTIAGNVDPENASLIAAAPDLLEALKAMVKLVTRTPLVIHPEVEQVVAAILKAEGAKV